MTSKTTSEFRNSEITLSTTFPLNNPKRFHQLSFLSQFPGTNISNNLD